MDNKYQKMMRLEVPPESFILPPALGVANRIISYNMDKMDIPVTIKDYEDKTCKIRLMVSQTLIGWIPKVWLKEIEVDE